MKKITLILGILFSILFTACSVNESYDGRDGLDGIDGVNITGSVFDIEGHFTLDNEYKIHFEFPTTVEVFESDIVLIYILWDTTVDSNGKSVDVWRLLPQTRLLDQGILQYNYDHTFLDTDIFLEANFDLSTLTSGDTDNQVFRVAILPAKMVSAKLNKNNIADVMGVLNVKENTIVRTTMN